jgi:flagellar biosynthesis protein FlhG
MKPLSDQDHYEVLELEYGAPPEEIERAYRVAQATYAEDSVALYSVFGGEDASVLRQRIELAWSVLSDVERRRNYDQLLSTGTSPVDAHHESVVEFATDPTPRFSGISPYAITPRPAPALAVAPRPLPAAVLEPFEPDAEGPNALDGASLRRARVRRGLELGDIANVTKINPTYLQFLEDERFEDLPAPVYVRGFLNAYLRCCGIDPAVPTSTYMSRYEAGRAAPKKGHVAGRA